VGRSNLQKTALINFGLLQLNVIPGIKPPSTSYGMPKHMEKQEMEMEMETEIEN